jgi:hypothetical protein
MGIFVLILPLMFLGCEGDDGTSGTSVGSISGTVTNDATGTGLAGATVSTSPDQGSTTTAADGSYTLSSLPAGAYSVTFAKTDFGTETAPVSVLAGVTSTEDATLVPTVPVLVEISTTGTATPGSTLAATVTPMPLDGSTVTGVVWSQATSVTVAFDNTTATTTNVTLPDLAAYKDELFHVIAEPPITPAQLPPGVEAPEEFAEQLQDRFQVQAVAPFELEEAGLVTLVATVTTTSGTYMQEEEIHTELPWKQTTGIHNVPINVPVILHGGTQDNTQTTWDWSVTGPAMVTLDDATAQNPSFTPTTAGTYTLSESVSGASFDVVAGNWAGAITGQDGNGRPISSSCAPACHGTTGPNSIVTTIFGEWKESGHAEIFTVNFNTSTHYSPGCFPCHTVGFDEDASNGGIDDDANYSAFLDAFTSDGHSFIANPNNWDNLLATFPSVAKLTNIQCENCHGPNNGDLHLNSTLMDPERVSLSSSVCGSCHGEPARHGRYQQWQVSPHSNYELAIDEGDSESCSRCHTANGFIVWGEMYDFDGPTELDPTDITWNDNTVHPQTCAACHETHDVGTISGGANNAKVRVEDDTPLLAAGFTVLNAGRGAVCMVCHNTRRGLINDDNPGDVITGGRAPHAGAQADVLMGQNAFFVITGVRGKHSLITDTCSNCHMQQTDPPAVLSYNLGGTNHTFFASKDICSECHASITSEEVQGATQDQMSFLAASLEAKLQEMILGHVADNNTVTLTSWEDLTGTALDNQVINPGDTVTVTNYADFHGRQAVDVAIDNGVITTGVIQLRRILVDDGVTTPVPHILAFDANGATLAKSGWNYLMATNERSHGIHNNTFSLAILAAAQQEVDAIVVP